MTPVGLPDDIGDLIRANGRQLLFQFPHDFHLEGFTMPNLLPYPIPLCIHP